MGKDETRTTLVSYSDIQTLPNLSCYVTLPGPYPAVRMALKYQPRPRVAPEFISRAMDEAADRQLEQALQAREEESQSVAMLFSSSGDDADAGVPEGTASGAVPPASVVTPKAAAADNQTAPAGGMETDKVPVKLVAAEREPLPPGLSPDGEIVDAQAYATWQAYRGESLRDRQRQEEMSISHGRVPSEPEHDIDVGGGF